MPEKYAETRIREALELSKGDTLKARELLINWAHKDPKFLLAMAEPYLPGLVAYSIEQTPFEKPIKGVPVKNKKTKSGKGTDFGLGILKAAVSSRAEVFGLETPQASLKPETPASQEHVDAIRRLAKRTTKNKTSRE